MTPLEIEKTLNDLARRITRIECHLRLPSPTVQDAKPTKPTVPESTAVAEAHPVLPSPPKPPSVDVPARKPWSVAVHRLRTADKARTVDDDTRASAARDSDVQSTPWEVIIGARWMAWVGAVVTVLAAGFFVKLAYDLGWIGRLPPLVKCCMTAAFGVGLIAAGEFAFRRVGRIAAVGLFASGLGTLYLTALATFRYFELLPQSGAFALMAVVAALGLAITVRGRLVEIGVLSLLGGYLSPILLSEQATFAAALPLYLTTLVAVGLTLSAIRPDAFRLLRYVTLAFHACVTLLWLLREGSEHWVLAMVFLTVWWLLAVAESLWAAMRDQSPRGNCVVTLLGTFYFVTAGCGILADASPGNINWLGAFTGAIGVVCAWVALTLGPGWTILQRPPRRAIELFSATLWAQVGILVAAAIGLQFRSPGQTWGQSIGWLVMGAACIELGRRLPSLGVRVFGLIVGGLAVARVWSFDFGSAVLAPTIWSYGDVQITYWSLLGLSAVAVTQFAAARLGRMGDARWPLLAQIINFLCVLQWAAWCHVCCDHLVLTAGWLVGAVALLVVVRWRPKSNDLGIACLLLIVTTVKWLVFDAAGSRLSSTWVATANMPVINWQFATALAVVAGILGLAWRSRTRGGVETGPSRLAQIVLFAGVSVLLLALGFEVERAIARAEALGPPAFLAVFPSAQSRLLCFTLLGAVGYAGTWLVGRLARKDLLAAAGFAGLCAAAICWLTIDTLVWRLQYRPVPCLAVLNLQFLVGVLTVVMLVLVAFRVRRNPLVVAVSPSSMGALGQFAIIASLAMGLWLGSLELDRYFAPETQHVGNAAMARQTSLSVYWGIYAIGLVALGFWKGTSALRYAGLALLGVTLTKVLLVDMAQVQYVYRVLSLLAVGLLFIGTSVAYARVAARARTAKDGGHADPVARTRHDIRADDATEADR